MTRMHPVRDSARIVLVAWLVVLTGCCHVPIHDSQLVQAVNEWSSRADAFFIAMEAKAGTEEGQYDQNTRFYEATLKSIDDQVARVKTTPASDLVVDRLGLIRRDFTKLQELHQLGGAAGLKKEAAEHLRAGLQQDLSSLLEYEETLKKE
jgi:hypothetical protein